MADDKPKTTPAEGKKTDDDDQPTGPDTSQHDADTDREGWRGKLEDA